MTVAIHPRPPFTLGPRALMILELIMTAKRPPSFAILCRATGLSPKAMTEHVRTLERHGLVSREYLENGRVSKRTLKGACVFIPEEKL